MNDRSIVLRYYLPPVIWAAIIFVESSIPGKAFPKTPVGTDKLVHITIFFILAGLTHRAFIHLPSKIVSTMSLYLALVVTIVYGFFDEFHQMYVPGRTADMFDMAADALGGFLFIVVALVYGAARKNGPQSKNSL